MNGTEVILDCWVTPRLLCTTEISYTKSILQLSNFGDCREV